MIYVIDSTDEERLSESKEAFGEVKLHLDLYFLTHHPLTTQPSPPTDKMISSEALEGVPLLVLANKQDIPVMGHH